MDRHTHFGVIYANVLNSAEGHCEAVTGKEQSSTLPPWFILKHDQMVKSPLNNKVKPIKEKGKLEIKEKSKKRVWHLSNSRATRTITSVFEGDYENVENTK